MMDDDDAEMSDAAALRAETNELLMVGAVHERNTCRQCGCHTYMACEHLYQGNCWWAEQPTGQPGQPDFQGPLCSHCQMENEGLISDVDRPWKEVADA